jgi:hypothetical protein
VASSPSSPGGTSVGSRDSTPFSAFAGPSRSAPGNVNRAAAAGSSAPAVVVGDNFGWLDSLLPAVPLPPVTAFPPPFPAPFPPPSAAAGAAGATHTWSAHSIYSAASTQMPMPLARPGVRPGSRPAAEPPQQLRLRQQGQQPQRQPNYQHRQQRPPPPAAAPPCGDTTPRSTSTPYYTPSCGPERLLHAVMAAQAPPPPAAAAAAAAALAYGAVSTPKGGHATPRTPYYTPQAATPHPGGCVAASECAMAEDEDDAGWGWFVQR